jgi:hypothetical protein
MHGRRIGVNFQYGVRTVLFSTASRQDLWRTTAAAATTTTIITTTTTTTIAAINNLLYLFRLSCVQKEVRGNYLINNLHLIKL